MTMEQRSAFIPADIHKRLKLLAVENGTTVAAEHEKVLREAFEQRDRKAARRSSARQTEAQQVTA